MDEWIYFLKNEEIKDSFTAKGLKEAQEKLKLMKLPEDEQQAYNHYQDDLHYQASMFESSFGDGHREGRAEGEFEKARQIASRLSAQGMSTEEIAKITGLEMAEIKIILERKGED